MYVTRVEIENIKCFRHLVWEIDAGDAPGWHVILGDNGAGKSTFVRAIALAAVGPPYVLGLRQNFNNWLAQDVRNGFVRLTVNADKEVDQGSQNSPPSFPVVGSIFRDNEIGLVGTADNPFHSNFNNGWFIASYGPFRRFSGGSSEEERLFNDNPRLGRHLSAFSENIPLSEPVRWMKDLRLKMVDDDGKSARLINWIFRFLNQNDFLPNGAIMHGIHSDGPVFTQGGVGYLSLNDLSDGYKSVLSMTMEIIRQLTLAFETDIFEEDQQGKVFVKLSGVILIDEIDAHLHPTWQSRIGFWFREHFPNMQFVVTTHSPLICQAAEKGTIFKLPTPGTDETGRFITGSERDRLVYGNVLEAYSTEAFTVGEERVTRSETAQKMLEELGRLNVKELTQGLTPEETATQARLRAALPTSAGTLDPADE